jgi:two-component system sensor histidine kinase QseC
MSKPSLIRQLFWRIVPAILITILATGILAFRSATREINKAYDAQLINNANILWGLMSEEIHEAILAGSSKYSKPIDFDETNQIAKDEEVQQDANDYADDRMFRIWHAGKIIISADTSASADEVKQAPPGFSYEKYDKNKWRVYTTRIPEKDIAIEVGEKTALREELVENILLDLFFPFLIIIPVIGALTWFGIKHGLGPMRNLVGQIRLRSAKDLSAIDTKILPKDLVPLGGSINQLFEELENSLTAERRFTDHAAHQLRTPLAGLKLLLQMYARADGPDERAAIIRDLHKVNERAAHLVEQLLQAARVSHQPLELRPIALYPLIASVLADMGLLAHSRQIEISLEGDEMAVAQADEALLRVLAANLIDNAIKYSPASGHIRVAIRALDDHWCLLVEDSGPGIPEDLRSQVFQYFYRIETSEVEGTGIGLAIVANIAKRLGASIALTTPENGKGLCVEIMLKRA